MSMKLTRRQCLWALGSSVAAAAGRDLIQEWRRIAAETDGTVGAVVLHLASGQMVSLHGSERFPLASVCKVPIAVNMLALVDEGKLALDQEIERRDAAGSRYRQTADRIYHVHEMIRAIGYACDRQ